MFILIQTSVLDDASFVYSNITFQKTCNKKNRKHKQTLKKRDFAWLYKIVFSHLWSLQNEPRVLNQISVLEIHAN